jgi:hypothetical protein
MASLWCAPDRPAPLVNGDSLPGLFNGKDDQLPGNGDGTALDQLLCIAA